MRIELKGELARDFQEVMDMFDGFAFNSSFTFSEKRKSRKEIEKNVEKNVDSIRNGIFSSKKLEPYLIIEENSYYLSLISWGKIKFSKEKYVCKQQKDGHYPDIDELKKDLQIEKNFLESVNKHFRGKIKNFKELFNRAIIVSFCVKNKNHVLEVDLSDDEIADMMDIY